MPYKRVGSTVYHYKNHRWSIKQRCNNVKNAKAAMRILQDIEKRKG